MTDTFKPSMSDEYCEDNDEIEENDYSIDYLEEFEIRYLTLMINGKRKKYC